ncbi:unnamed protein product [Penicillium pancosmium]
MKFATATITTAILAGNALAAPGGSGLAARLEARGVLTRQSLPKIDNSDEVNGVLLKEGSSSAKVQYSKNWAGIVREKPPASDPTATDDSGDTQAASAWVGIDGDTYTKAILQTGIDAYVSNGDEKSYDAWYEWYPNPAENFQIDLSAGDVIVATVESNSPSEGVAIIENKSSGKSVTKTLSAPSTSATLGGQNAEWIVEDFNSGSSMVPLANFGEITFTGAQAKGGDSEYGVNDGSILDIQQNGQVLAHVEVESDTEFTVTYE